MHSCMYWRAGPHPTRHLIDGSEQVRPLKHPVSPVAKTGARPPLNRVLTKRAHIRQIKLSRLPLTTIPTITAMAPQRRPMVPIRTRTFVLPLVHVAASLLLRGDTAVDVRPRTHTVEHALGTSFDVSGLLTQVLHN